MNTIHKILEGLNSDSKSNSNEDIEKEIRKLGFKIKSAVDRDGNELNFYMLEDKNGNAVLSVQGSRDEIYDLYRESKRRNHNNSAGQLSKSQLARVKARNAYIIKNPFMKNGGIIDWDKFRG